MNNFLLITFLLFAFCVILSGLYWLVIQPVLVRSFLFRLFAKRDSLRRAGITKQEDKDSFSYIFLESLICNAIQLVPHASLWNFLAVMAKQAAVPEDTKRFNAEATEFTKKLRDSMVADTLCILVCNAPILSLFSLVSYFVMWILGKTSKAEISNGTQKFVRELPSQPMMPQVA